MSTEYNLEAIRKIMIQQGREIGYEDGYDQGRGEMIQNALKNLQDAEQVSKLLNVPIHEVQQIEEKMKQ